MSSPCSPALRTRLTDAADPKVKASYERYFRNAVRFVGVRASTVRGIHRELLPMIASHSPDEPFEEARSLLHSQFAEEKQVATGFGDNAQRGRRRQ